MLIVTEGCRTHKLDLSLGLRIPVHFLRNDLRFLLGILSELSFDTLSIQVRWRSDLLLRMLVRRRTVFSSDAYSRMWCPS